MFFRFPRLLACLSAAGMSLVFAGCGNPGAAPEPSRRQLRVCADPNNLPFSNEREEGLENRIADLIAEEMDAEVVYTWHAQRRGFARNTLRAGLCDVIMGVPTGYEMALTTRAYYRSTYVFVSRRDSGIQVASMDDPLLRTVQIGVHVIGDDYMNPPPAHALGRRRIVGNVRGYSIFGDYSQPDPPARLIEAVARGDVDIAIVWGPFAGYFAPKQDVELEVEPVMPEIDLPFLPFVFDIAMGVERGNNELKSELEEIMDRRQSDIDQILRDYGIPLKPVHLGSGGPTGR